MDPKDKMYGRRFGGRWAGRGGPGGRGGWPEQRERWQAGPEGERPSESSELSEHRGHWRRGRPSGGPGGGPERPEAAQHRHEGRPEGGPGRPERPDPRGGWGEDRLRGGPGGPLHRLYEEWGRRGGPRAGRGDVRAAVLSLLTEKPLHGYEIIQQITARSGGAWRPSPGSVYPALQLLEDQGLIASEQTDGRRVFHLTDEGRAHVEQHKTELDAGWSAVANTVDDAVREVHDLLGQVGTALQQVIHAGTPGQITQARTLLVNTRRQLYRILADDEPTGSEPATGDTIHS
ncbi:MAG: helix-turn-helix transcriptional regulator [Herpetosiphonaceae bacterium]|nr:helix-turn-helix transcriptional regulator [Herpetosiphonaceae bacterium]